MTLLVPSPASAVGWAENAKGQLRGRPFYLCLYPLPAIGAELSRDQVTTNTEVMIGFRIGTVKIETIASMCSPAHQYGDSPAHCVDSPPAILDCFVVSSFAWELKLGLTP